MGQMMELRTLAQLLAEYDYVTNLDVVKVVELANRDPHDVWVREMLYDKCYPLSQIARGRFLWRIEGAHQVMVGFDRSDCHAKIRIADAGGTVELSKWVDGAWTRWMAPALGSVRILLPKAILQGE